MTRFSKDILFKETIRSEAKGYYKHKKQNGGPGQFAIVELRIRPLIRGGGFRFVDLIVEGKIPASFIPSVEKGVKEALAKGILAAYPIVDIEVELIDGAHHKKDSHARDFQVAGGMAFRDAMRQAAPALLEPIGVLEAACPTPSFGWLLGDLAKRRGRIRGRDFRDGLHVVQADIPILELPGFDSELRNATSGSGSYSIRPSHDEVMPESVMSALLRQLATPSR